MTIIPPSSTNSSAEMRGRPTATRARAFGIAAIRETYEEVGLFIGVSAGDAAAVAAKGASFSGFAEAGVEPSLASLRFVARAITPPNRPRRFDTRFFACFAKDIAAKTSSSLGPSGELEDVAWLTFEEAKRAEIPAITATILDEVAIRLASDPTSRTRNESALLSLARQGVRADRGVMVGLPYRFMIFSQISVNGVISAGHQRSSRPESESLRCRDIRG